MKNVGEKEKKEEFNLSTYDLLFHPRFIISFDFHDI
jgi:hypothetical protein